MPLDPLSLVTREDRPQEPDRTWYAADPEVVYPAILDHIEECLTGKHPIAPNVRMYAGPAQQLDADAWLLARTPRNLVADADVPLRMQALELARQWFTERLHAAIGAAPMGLHWLKRPDWKL